MYQVSGLTFISVTLLAISMPVLAAPSHTSQHEPAPSRQTIVDREDVSTVKAPLWPRSEQRHVLDAFTRYFSKPRSHDDQETKTNVRESIVLYLKDLGFETTFLQRSRFDVRRHPALSHNIISIIGGRNRRTKDERIFLIGAHWDSATKAPGVDDNGSGSVCLLEIARLLSKHKCSFNDTVMLVWFDYEEHGKCGSEFFVNDYLFPLELDMHKSKFVGAYIMDMILVRDKENNTQSIPQSVVSHMPNFVDELEREKYRGDFLAAWSRDIWDDPLLNAFARSWKYLGFESRTFKPMRTKLPQWTIPTHEERFKWKDFFRSDHASFWYPSITNSAVRRAPDRHNSGSSRANHTIINANSTLFPDTAPTTTAPAPSHPSLNAVLLTDLGPWRKSYTRCYHSACDDTRFLTDNNVAFMQQVIDSLLITLGRVAGGSCPAYPDPRSDESAFLEAYQSLDQAASEGNAENITAVPATAITPASMLVKTNSGDTSKGGIMRKITIAHGTNNPLPAHITA